MRRKPSVLRERRDQRDRCQSLAALARRHGGYVRRDQALALSVSDDAIRHRISRGGRWQRVLPGLYATFRGELSAQDRCRAAVLYAGADAQLTGPTALRQFRVRYLPDDDGCVHVLVAHATSRQNRGFVAFTRTTRLPRPWWRDGLP